MKFFTSLLFVVALSASLILLTSGEEDEDKPEERDPWDKSTDRYHHDNAGDGDLRVDVTETSESEVHTERKSKLRGEIANVEKQYGKIMEQRKKMAAKKKKKKKKKVEKSKKKPKTVMKLKSGKGKFRSEPKIDVETKQQFDDATDEKDPIDDMSRDEQARAFSSTAQKKAFNYWGDFYPGSLWEYPYPYFHPQYHCNQQVDCPCLNPTAVEAKMDDANLLTGVPLKKPKKGKRKQLIPSHYYGPPSAGWGSFEPGKTGCGWGTPYWYKKRHNIHDKKHGSRQLIPSHYYGPPSAGWGSFEPGKTGCGWGTPYWYKKRDTVHNKKKKHGSRQLIPSHYYGPPSAGWGSFEPGKTGCGWGTPYWYKSTVPLKPKSERAARKFYVHGIDPENLGHTGYAGWDSGFGRGRGSTAWGRPNIYGWGPKSWQKGGKNNVDFMAWFGPNSFGSNGWGGQGWVSNYGMMYNGKPLGMPNEATGFGAVGSDVARIDETIGQGDFAATTSNLLKGRHKKLIQTAANPELGVPDDAKMDVGMGGNEKIHTENIVEQGVAKRIQTPDVSSEDGPSDTLTSDVLQVSNDADTSDEKSGENLNSPLSEISEKQSDNDQGIAEVVKDSNGDTKVSNIDDQLPENAETSTALPSPATVDLTSMAETNSKVPSKENSKEYKKEESNEKGKVSSENESQASAEVAKEKPKDESTPSKSEEQATNTEKFTDSKTSHESGDLQTIKTPSEKAGDLQTIKTPSEKTGKVSSPKEAAAQEEMKAKVDQLIKQAKSIDKEQEEKMNMEKKLKEEEALRKQEEAYSTIKSKAANTVENLKMKAKVKTDLYTSKRQPQPKLKTVKTEAANEKPLTI